MSALPPHASPHPISPGVTPANGALTRWLRGWGGWALLALAVIAGLLVAHQALYRSGLAQVESAARARLSGVVLSLASAMDRHDRLPRMLTEETALVAALFNPDDPAIIARANARLRFLETSAGVSNLYLMTFEGTTIASGNWDQPVSFIGHNFAFRSYFLAARRGETGRFYAVGSVSGEPGYFIAEPIRIGGAVIGVIAAKVALADQAEQWARAKDAIAVVDRHGVVLLSSFPEWLSRALAPIAPEERARLLRDRQYGEHPLEPLWPVTAAPLVGAARQPVERAELGGAALPVSERIAKLGWDVVLFAPIEVAEQRAASWTLALALGTMALAAVAVFWRQRRKRYAERLLAAASLRRLEQDLSSRIERHAEELERNRARLNEQSALLQQSERILAETQTEAMQAGKLAALGQMAAGISHELNQPLTAITTLSDNASAFLDKNRLADLRDNLRIIGETARRMGSIVGQLKSFARKESMQLHPVSVKSSIDASLRLLDSALTRGQVRIICEGFRDDQVVEAEETRLQQVFLNLIRNAIEAVPADGTGEVRLTLDEAGAELGWLSIRVKDNGSGLSEEARQRLFEPFYTTKAKGAGLGLGLALSQAIIRSFGGEIRVENRPESGACFTIRLRRA